MAGKKPYMAVALVQVIYAGMFLLSKAAFNGGLNNFVFVFCRQAAATVYLVPLALHFEWRTWPSLSFVTCCKICLTSLFGITASLDTYGLALLYTSPTLAAAAANCLPAITFFVAVLLRWKWLQLRTTSGLSKLAGIVLRLGGAGLLQGSADQTPVPSSSRASQHEPIPSIIGHELGVKGCFLMLLANFCWSFWLVSQCFVSSIQTLVVAALSLVKDPFGWKLGWNIRLLSVAHCVRVAFYLQIWVIEKRGPVFLAMSTPLALIITALVSSFLPCDTLTFGRILGGVLLVGGLYSVLWGKSRDKGQDQ